MATDEVLISWISHTEIKKVGDDSDTKSTTIINIDQNISNIFIIFSK